MNNKLFLSPEEIKELTGYTQYTAQRRHLQKIGITYILARDGSPRVLRSELESKMVSGHNAVKTSEPNWEAVNG